MVCNDERLEYRNGLKSKFYTIAVKCGIMDSSSRQGLCLCATIGNRSEGDSDAGVRQQIFARIIS